MHPLWSIIALVTLTAPSMQPVDDALFGPTVSVDRMDAASFERMNRTAQHTWLREVIARLDRAGRLVLSPDEAAKQEAAIAQLLRRLAQGERLSAAEAEDLLRQTDQHEKAAVEQLARKFRVQVYQTFRQRRGTFTRRRAAWNRVHADWEAAGGSLEEQDRLLDWLQAAIRVSLPDSVGPLPEDPAFRIVEPSAEQIVLDEPTRSVTPIPIVEPVPTVRPTPIVEPVPVVERAPIAESVPRPGSTDRRNVIVPPPIAQPDANGLQSRQPSAVASAAGTRRDIARRQPAGDGATVARRPSTMETMPESTVMAEPVILHEPTTETTSIGVNVGELAARTAGMNLAIRELEADLRRRGPWSSAYLRPLIDRLGRLMDQRNDLTLFHELLADDERASVERLDSPEALISQIGARIFEARNRVNESDFEGTETQRHAELKQLDELSRRLALMASQR